MRAFTKDSRTQSSLKPWTAVYNLCEKSLKFSLWFFVGAYRTLGTSFLGGGCRFSPSCSEYALEALKVHPAPTAAWLITKRICKCRPGGSCGDDPVPPAGGF